MVCNNLNDILQMSRYGKEVDIERGRAQVGQYTADDGGGTEIQTAGTN